MASVTVTLVGIEELRQALQNLPTELVAEANQIVRAAGEKSKDETAAAYNAEQTPVPDLTTGLRLTGVADSSGAQWRLLNRHPLAHLYEFGTATRQTSLGYNRGAARAHPTLVPIAMTNRAAMYEQLRALVLRAGFELVGS